MRSSWLERRSEERRAAHLRDRLEQAGAAAAADRDPPAVGRQPQVLVVVRAVGDPAFGPCREIDPQDVGVRRLVRSRAERAHQHAAAVRRERLQFPAGAHHARVVQLVGRRRPPQPGHDRHHDLLAVGGEPDLREADVPAVRRDPCLTLVLDDDGVAGRRDDQGHQFGVVAAGRGRRALEDGVIGRSDRRLVSHPDQQPAAVGERHGLEQRLSHACRDAAGHAGKAGPIGCDRQHLGPRAAGGRAGEHDPLAVPAPPREPGCRDRGGHGNHSDVDALATGSAGSTGSAMPVTPARHTARHRGQRRHARQRRREHRRTPPHHRICLAPTHGP
jgi:hypothetical protein